MCSISDFRFLSRFPIPNRDFRFELTWQHGFRFPIPIREIAISRFHDFDFAISRFRFGSARAPSLLTGLRPYTATVRPAEHGNSRGNSFERVGCLGPHDRFIKRMMRKDADIPRCHNPSRVRSEGGSAALVELVFNKGFTLFSSLSCNSDVLRA